ncbi:hypothetical protein C8A05DRAFT_17963 [Staphylotrichum tortipilum]|uniref:Uncharacterized protein n=1 Tax=Staphylotrichum tortipilum TaxID=2831512 RepID=A0AAN6MG88_9PEZI|nr:hypothetical protein C8A05DRAFT_17963 [Staphylotrichum longicolle]
MASTDRCLGIDIGSHRTRVCIRVMSTETELVVENPQYLGLSNAYTPCDFPSALYLFDDIGEDVYLLDDDDTGRRWVSAKYVFYALANASDALLEQYPSVHHLMERKDEPEFALQDAAAAVCRDHGLRIVKIGLTIPVQWGLEFEDVYRALVLEVLEMVDTSRVYFFTEAEALARYLYKYQAHKLDPSDQHNAILFFDFGGHNMNGCLFGVTRDPNRPDGNGFFRVGTPFGAGGGSEQWEHHIGQWFSHQYFEDTGVPAPPDELELFLRRFRPQKGKRTESRKVIRIILSLPDDSGTWRSTLTMEEINRAWRKGLSGPLRTARRAISHLLHNMEQEVVSRPLVVVSGGTARNPAVKSYMAVLCHAEGVPVVFTDELDVRIVHASAQVAKAAAFVVSKTFTVEQFFHRGAAIGLQMRQPLEQGKPRTDFREWDDSGALLLDRNGPHTALISVRNSDEFRLICDPFFNTLPGAQRNRVAANRTYDVVYLGRRKQGCWVFRCRLHGSGDKMHLKLYQSYSRKRGLPLRDKTTLDLPLYFDGSSGCIHVGDRNRDISELSLDLPPQPRDLGVMTADDSSS